MSSATPSIVSLILSKSVGEYVLGTFATRIPPAFTGGTATTTTRCPASRPGASGSTSGRSGADVSDVIEPEKVADDLVDPDEFDSEGAGVEPDVVKPDRADGPSNTTRMLSHPSTSLKDSPTK
jgi:hypothetical protein